MHYGVCIFALKGAGALRVAVAAPEARRPRACDATTTPPLSPQIREFLQFFEIKRDLYVTEVEALFNDAKEARYVGVWEARRPPRIAT